MDRFIPDAPREDDVYTVKELSKGLLVTKLTIYKWCRGEVATERLETIKTPDELFGKGLVFVKEKKLLRWLKKYRPHLIPVWENRHNRKNITISGRASYAEARINALVDAKVAKALAER